MSASGRLELAEHAARLYAAGLTQAETGRVLGISRSYAAELLTDPDGAKQRARRETYKGVCGRCGGETRSNGTSHASRICLDCAAEVARLNRKWTRDAVIDAIRRYAVAHGRPPTATAWRLADAANGYPAARTVYGDSVLFRSWADAIEAAGFPRPQVGHYQPVEAAARCRGCGVEFTYRRRGPAPLRCVECKRELRCERQRAYTRRPEVKAKLRAYRRDYYRKRRAGLENVAPATKLSTHPQPAS